MCSLSPSAQAYKLTLQIRSQTPNLLMRYWRSPKTFLFKRYYAIAKIYWAVVCKCRLTVATLAISLLFTLHTHCFTAPCYTMLQNLYYRTETSMVSCFRVIYCTTGSMLRDGRAREIVVRFAPEKRNFSLLQNSQISSETHQASYSVGTGFAFLGVKWP